MSKVIETVETTYINALEIRFSEINSINLQVLNYSNHFYVCKVYMNNAMESNNVVCLHCQL